MHNAHLWMRTQEEEHTRTELASEWRTMSLVEGRLNLKYMEGIKTGCPKGSGIYWSGAQKSDVCVGFRFGCYQLVDEIKRIGKMSQKDPERL